MIATIHQPTRNEYPGVAVIEYSGLRGNSVNAGPRMDMAADLAHVTMIHVQRQGTNTTVFDLGMRASLHPTVYDQTMREQVDELHETVAELGCEAEKLVGHGVSAGGAPIGALAKLGLFERAMFRGAVNLRASTAPEHAVPGILRFVGFLAMGEWDKPAPPPDAPAVPDAGEQISTFQKYRQIATEIRHYGPLMLSTYTAETLRQLAAYPLLPLSFVAFGHEPTGSYDQAVAFANELMAIRHEANKPYQLVNKGAAGAAISALISDRPYHSDLVSRPDITASHLKALFKLEPAL